MIARRLMVLLVAVIGILVDTTTVASASTASQGRGSSRSAALVVSETRVGVADHSAPVFVGSRAPGNPAGVGEKCPRFDGAAVGSCVATKTGAGVVDDHIVLGKSIGLEETAGKVGGRTLMNDANWKQSVLDAINTPGTKITVSLDGVPGSSVRSQVMTAAQRGASGVGAPFDWEMAQLYQAGKLSGVTFVQGGKVVVNPFG